MSVQCIACQKFTFKEVGDMARLGYGNCAHDAKFILYGATKERECGQIDPAPAEVIEKRKAWLQEQKQ